MWNELLIVGMWLIKSNVIVQFKLSYCITHTLLMHILKLQDFTKKKSCVCWCTATGKRVMLLVMVNTVVLQCCLHTFDQNYPVAYCLARRLTITTTEQTEIWLQVQHINHTHSCICCGELVFSSITWANTTGLLPSTESLESEPDNTGQLWQTHV